ncbi:hypothetical protein F9C07_2223132 [Aspergillus flavus]|uniref:Aminoglycoside phosphotransferase domain-containing protein n=2 Tax=Aspergillus subgen. Circumdati TaxID=2720871 RepID=A0A7U2QUM0_ASPFN|nr:hypothetical protein F9C07_2223132 [Aspergillus flavus]
MDSSDNISQLRVIYNKGDHIVLQDEERKTIHKCGKEGFKIYEALTLIYINDNTNISVPKIRSIQYEDGRELNVRYDEAGKSTNIRYEDDKVYEVKYDEQGKSTYTPCGNDDVVQITMGFVEGDTLEKVWKDFTYDQKEVLAGDLKRYVSELRKLKGEKIAALNDGKVRVLSGSRYAQEGGPFESREEFNQFLELIGEEDAPQGCEEFVFSHGDILPRNILVNDQGKVTALVDWEFAGYFPMYWEYSRASRESKDWKEFLLLWVFPDKREWGYTEMKSLNIRS